MRKQVLRYALIPFLIVEAVLGVCIHTVSPAYLYSYISIVLAALFCLALYERTTSWLFTQVGLLFTLGADFFLVVLASHHTVAMLLFSVAQLSYAARLALAASPRERRVGLISRATVSLLAVGLTVIVLGKNTDALAVVSLFYFANLIVNAVIATVKWRSSPLLAIGFWLFILCDVFVGFSMLGGYLPLADNAFLSFLAAPPINMAWVFYLPSQVLISLSTLKTQK